MKKFVTMLLAVMLVMSCAISVSAAREYTPSKWAQKASNALELTWYENTTRNVEKGEFMFSILRMIQASRQRVGESLLESDTDLDFYDEDELTTEEQDEARILVDLGVLNGYKGYMNMYNDIKRSEAAKVLTFFNEELELPYVRKAITFSDCIDHWAEDSIKTAYRLGLVNGSGKDTDGSDIFLPDKNLTIEELVQILYNISTVNDDFTYEDIAASLVSVFNVETDLDLDTDYEDSSSVIYLNIGEKLTYSTNSKGVWTSSNRSCVSVNSSGVITANAQGKATITHGSTAITVYVGNSPIYVEVGGTKEISNKISSYWKSSNKKVATVDRYAVVKGVSEGTATISREDDESYKVTVVDSTIIELKVGETEELGSSSNKWTSSNTKVATVTSKGVVKAVGSGVATITNRYGKYLVVVPNTSHLEMNIGDTIKFDTSTNWKSSNSRIVSINGGYIKAVTKGIATVSNDYTSITITVAKGSNSSTDYDTEEITLEVGDVYSLGSKYDDWYSSNSRVASVSSYGKVTANKVGTATITNRDTGNKYYITVIDSDDGPSYDDSDVQVYVEGFEPNSYYNAFVDDTIKVIVKSDSKLKSVTLSNSKCTLVKEISSMGNNKYTFTVTSKSAGACVLTLNFANSNHTEFTINSFKD